VSALLTERDRAISAMNEQRQQLTQELRIKQEEVHQMEKSFNKQVDVCFHP
jgi:HAMP domain-containing protein